MYKLAPFFFGFLLSQAQATTFAPRPFEEWVDRAPLVVRGVTGDKHADWYQEPEGDSRRIYTYTEFTVSEVLKGQDLQNGQVISLREMGGESGGVGLEVPGSASFKRGEDVVVFLSIRSPDGSYPMHGMMMGKMNVIKNYQGVEELWGPVFLGAHDSGANANPAGTTTFNRAKKKTVQDLKNILKKQGTLRESNATTLVSPKPESLSAIASASPQGLKVQQDDPMMPKITLAPPAEVVRKDSTKYLYLVGVVTFSVFVALWISIRK